MLLPEDLSPPPFTDDELDAWFEWQDTIPEYTEDDPLRPEEPAPAKWQITDTGSAEWAMARYSHTAARIEEAELAAKEFHRQIDDWLRRETLPLHHRANFFFGHLTRFLQDRREDPSDRRATVKLPSGDIVSRKVPARPEIVKEAEQDFIEWARERKLPVVKAKWSPVMKEVKQHIEFRPVLVPKVGDYGVKLWHLDDGHLIAVPTMPPESVIEMIDGLTRDTLIAHQTHDVQIFGVFETGTGYELVPGVVQVPEHVNYDVKQARP